MPLAPIALTMGDPAGIGPDITLSIWAARARNDTPSFVLYADPHLLRQRAQILGLDVDIHLLSSARVSADKLGSIFADQLPVIPLELGKQVTCGAPDPDNGYATIKSIENALSAVCAGQASAIVTNPIAKQTLYECGFEHPGHTEFLAALATRHAQSNGAPNLEFHPVMMLACEALRVVPLTIHIPLKDVPGAISPALIRKCAHTTHDALVRDFGISNPRLAITGLNPHAGEGGTMGTEDERIIKPAIEQLRKDGLAVTGPHPADTLFHAAARKGYDAAIAMYHDQALIPVKTLAFDLGVNVTLGLPFVRTSPDHGTAFDIAGSGKASPASLIAALKLAHNLVLRRAASQDAAVEPSNGPPS